MSQLVATLAYDKLCTFEFGCAIEFFALERPELQVPWYRHAVCAAEPGPLRAMGGVMVQCTHTLDFLQQADTIVIPGWRDVDEVPPLSLLNALRAAHARGARLCTICSGVFVLAHAGLLDGKPATTHWRYHQRLTQQFPSIKLEPGLYVDAGQIITSAGSAAGLDMMLHLVRSDYGPDIANQVAQRLVIAPHRAADQAQQVQRPSPSSAPSRLAKLQDWLLTHLRTNHSLQSMAEQAGISARSLQRQFQQSCGLSPQQWLIHQRITLAQDLLESQPALSLETVADLSGLGSVESMRRHFRHRQLPPPSQLRRRSQHAFRQAVQP